MDKPLWTPEPAAVADSNMVRFMEVLNEPGKTQIGGADELHRFSTSEPEQFWSALWKFCNVKGEMGEAPYLIDGGKMPGARFFPGGKLNFAENLLEFDGGDAPALIFFGEDRTRREVSWDELRAQISRVQQAFAALGVGRGDRVAAMMPNVPETIIAMLAASSLGAVWSSCSPDFGVQGVLDRFSQINPKIFIGCEGYNFNGKSCSVSERLELIVEQLPSVEHAILLPGIDGATGTCARIDRAIAWDAALEAFEPKHLDFERLPFSHPLYILFSSGTTGVPKCIVHSSGGVLLQHLKEHQLHCDLCEGERLFYFTTCGWMMWNWLVTGLASGVTLLLYDGSPMHEDGKLLFDFAEGEKINVFGVSAKFIDVLRNARVSPGETHDLSAMRMMLSTGSPLSPESFEYVYSNIKRDVHLASIAGGTDIVSCFVLGHPQMPVWSGEVQAAGLGMAVEIFDASGKSLGPDEGKGELVCTAPFPSMPLGFWNDDEGKKYFEAYFTRFPNVWHHGDFAEWTQHGGMIIHGRSDATLNPGGVRIGTAEIYRQVEQLDEVSEAIVIGQEWDNDVRVILFVILAEGVQLNDTLEKRIKTRIRQGASPRHVPAKIIRVNDIPRTKSGKITELAVRDIVAGREIKNIEALANPDALELFRNLAELQN